MEDEDVAVVVEVVDLEELVLTGGAEAPAPPMRLDYRCFVTGMCY